MLTRLAPKKSKRSRPKAMLQRKVLKALLQPKVERKQKPKPPLRKKKANNENTPLSLFVGRCGRDCDRHLRRYDSDDQAQCYRDGGEYRKSRNRAASSNWFERCVNGSRMARRGRYHPFHHALRCAEPLQTTRSGAFTPAKFD